MSLRDPFVEACERLAASEPEAYATVVSHLWEVSRTGYVFPSDDETLAALGRVEGALVAASLYFNPFFSPTLKDTP